LKGEEVFRQQVRMGVRAGSKETFRKATLFTFARNVTNAFFYTRIVVEKHEKVAILEKKKKMLVVCRQ